MDDTDTHPAVPYTTVTSQPCRRDRDHSQRTDSRVHRPERTSLASGLNVHGPWLSSQRPCATADSHTTLMEPHVSKPPQGSDSPSVCALGHLHLVKNVDAPSPPITHGPRASQPWTLALTLPAEDQDRAFYGRSPHGHACTHTSTAVAWHVPCRHYNRPLPFVLAHTPSQELQPCFAPSFVNARHKPWTYACSLACGDARSCLRMTSREPRDHTAVGVRMPMHSPTLSRVCEPTP